MNSPQVQRLISYWQTLTPDTVAAIDKVYAEDAYFRDPFNEVRGLEKIRPLFHEMFVRVDDPRFTIIEAIEQENSVVLIWDFEFRIKRLDPTRLRRIRGASHIRFAADGRTGGRLIRRYSEVSKGLDASSPSIPQGERSI